MDGSASFVGLGSVLARYFGIPYLDSIGSMIITGYISFMAYVALKELTLVLVDSVNDLLLRDTIKKHIEKRFNIWVSDVLIRRLGYSFAVEASIILNKNTILGEKVQRL